MKKPSPFGDKNIVMGNGKLNIEALDATAVDAQKTNDKVRIKKGETVKWNNSSLLAHSVTADPAKSTVEGSVQLPDGANSFDSGMLDPQQTYQHTFNKVGTYQYFCIPHEGTKMYGWIIVTEK